MPNSYIARYFGTSNAQAILLRAPAMIIYIAQDPNVVRAVR